MSASLVSASLVSARLNSARKNERKPNTLFRAKFQMFENTKDTILSIKIQMRLLDDFQLLWSLV